jgi:hypothetical protein
VQSGPDWTPPPTIPIKEIVVINTLSNLQDLPPKIKTLAKVEEKERRKLNCACKMLYLMTATKSPKQAVK